MICKNCGKSIPNNSDICPECGGSLYPNVPQANAKSLILKEKTDHAIIWYVQKKAVYKALVALAVLVVGIGLVRAALSFFDRIDFTRYVLVEVTGYDGRGSLDVQIDSEGLSGKLFGKDPSELDISESQMLSEVVRLLQIGLELEGTSSGYSNGDEVVLRISNLEALSEVTERKCKRNDSITYTVKDLKEASSVAFGDMFDVSFAGFNGAGYVLVTPNGADVPWDISYYSDEIYIDGLLYTIYSGSANAGELSNGDTITLGLIPEWEDNSLELLDMYGMCVTDDETSYTVSGLSDPENIDVLSMVEVMFSGVEGSVEVGYRWEQEEYQQGNVRIVPRNSESNSFGLTVSSVAWNNGGIVMLYDSGDLSTEDQDLGWFYLTADKDENISAGDTVTVTISTDYLDLEGGELARYGVEFASLKKEVTVDATMIPRMVTSLDQVNAENLSTLAQRLTDSVKGGLEQDWSRIVHGNRNYVCYDQTITGGPEVLGARLVCTDTSSNSYSIWIIYATQVTDSELDEAQMIYTTIRLDRPVVFQDEDRTVDYLGSMQTDFARDFEAVSNSWWYQSENGVSITF